MIQGIATIFRYVCLEWPDSVSHPFRAMEYVKGKSLRTLINHMVERHRFFYGERKAVEHRE